MIWNPSHAKAASRLALPDRPVLTFLAGAAWLLCGAWPLAGWAQVRAPAAAAAAAGPDVELSLRQLVQALRAGNRSIQSRANEHAVADAALDKARGAFQSQVNVAFSNGRQLQRTTPEEDLARLSAGNQVAGLYDRRGQDYSVGVSKLMESGAKVEAKATLSDFITNVTRTLRQSDTYDHRAFYGVTLTQPLARDFGRDVTLARVHVAELDAETAGLNSLDTESSVVAEACLAYLDLVFAQQRVAISQERIQMGQRMLSEAQARVRQGRAPASDVWEVESSLSRYRSSLAEAEQQRLDRMNRLRTMLGLSVLERPQPWRATDPLPDMLAQPPSALQGVELARERRPDLKAKRLALAREEVQADYARNQLLPRVDLLMSAGVNGLDTDRSQSLSYQRMKDFPTWSVGFQMAFPLGENQQGQADLRTALTRRDDARQAVESLEASIANDIDTSLGLLGSALQRWQLAGEVAAREQQLLELDRRRMTEGRIAMRDVLVSEERASSARLVMLEQQTQHGKALVLLDAAQGTLLDKFAS
jgi:outer membrane protein TolC